MYINENNIIIDNPSFKLLNWIKIFIIAGSVTITVLASGYLINNFILSEENDSSYISSQSKKDVAGFTIESSAATSASTEIFNKVTDPSALTIIRFYGGLSFERGIVEKVIYNAAKNMEVEGVDLEKRVIFIHIDSLLGGSVHLESITSTILAARKKYNVKFIAFVSGAGAYSLALNIILACNEIHMTPTAMIGGLGLCINVPRFNRNLVSITNTACIDKNYQSDSKISEEAFYRKRLDDLLVPYIERVSELLALRGCNPKSILYASDNGLNLISGRTDINAKLALKYNLIDSILTETEMIETIAELYGDTFKSVAVLELFSVQTNNGQIQMFKVSTSSMEFFKDNLGPF